MAINTAGPGSQVLQTSLCVTQERGFHQGAFRQTSPLPAEYSLVSFSGVWVYTRASRWNLCSGISLRTFNLGRGLRALTSEETCVQEALSDGFDFFFFFFLN